MRCPRPPPKKIINVHTNLPPSPSPHPPLSQYYTQARQKNSTCIARPRAQARTRRTEQTICAHRDNNTVHDILTKHRMRRFISYRAIILDAGMLFESCCDSSSQSANHMKRNEALVEMTTELPTGLPCKHIMDVIASRPFLHRRIHNRIRHAHPVGPQKNPSPTQTFCDNRTTGTTNLRITVEVTPACTICIRSARGSSGGRRGRSGSGIGFTTIRSSS